MDLEYILNEHEKCKDLFYFYNNYVRGEDQPILSEEEFDKRVKYFYLSNLSKRDYDR